MKKVDNLYQDKTFYPAASNLAAIKSRQGKLDEAISDLSELIKKFPYEPILFNNRADYYMQKGEFKKALRDANEALKIKDSYISAYATRGEIYFKMGNRKKAGKDFSKAIELGSKDSKIFKLLEECR